MNKDPDNLYLNIRINRGGDTDPRYYTNIATYDIVQNNPIINNPSEYYMAVTDFSIPLESIPINIARVIPNQPDPNLMVATFTITDSFGAETTQNVIYIPSTNIPPPIQNQPYQIITNYYFVYSYGFLLSAFNNTLASLITAAGIVLPPGIIPPYFTLVNDSFQKIMLIVPDFFIINNIQIGFNDATLNYLGGFDLFYDINSTASRHKIQFINTNNICDEFGTFDPAGQYWKYIQQNYVLPQWNCLSKILIYTSSIPIRNQQSTSNNILSPDLLSNLPIIYSDIPNYDTVAQARNYTYLNNAVEYKLIDLISETPLRKIQINIAWMDHNGEIFPLYLQPFNSCNIQLAFFRKELYNPNYKPRGKTINY